MDKKKLQNQSASASKNIKIPQSKPESAKQPIPPLSSSLKDEPYNRQRAHTLSETRIKSGTFSSDQQLKLEELRKKLLSGENFTFFHISIVHKYFWFISIIL